VVSGRFALTGQARSAIQPAWLPGRPGDPACLAT